MPDWVGWRWILTRPLSLDSLASMRKSLLLAVSAVILAALPAYSLYGLRPKLGTSSAVRVAENYVKASYARNFAAAYRWLSSEDQKRTSKEAFAAERGSFTGFTARLAATLADFIEAKPVETAIADSHARIKIKLRVPDPDQLATHLLAWDEERLNLLSVQEQKSLMAKIDRLHTQKKIPFTESEETFDLVKENSDWRIRLNSKENVRVQILVKLPPSAPLQVEAVPKVIDFQPGEPFTVKLHVKNQSDNEVWAGVAHTVEPQFVAEFMGLRDCGAFIPFRLTPKTEKENSATFLVWTDMPNHVKEFAMVYEFAVDKQ